MSLLQKQYKEPEGLQADPTIMLQHLRQLRETLELTMDEFVKHGSRSYPRPDLQQKVTAILEETKLY